MPPLSVVVPTHGRPKLLQRTLHSLEQCLLPESYRELVVVENGSREGAEELVKALPEELNARYLYVAQGNKSHALNEALKTLDEGLVVFFDDDVRVDSNVITAYADASEGKSSGYFFGGSTGVDYESPPADWIKSFLPNSARGIKLHPSEYSIEYLGFNWAAFVKDIQAVGGFDPHYGPGSPSGGTGDETKMQHCLLASGVKPQNVPDAFVWHYVPIRRCHPRWVLKRGFKTGLANGSLALNRDGNKLAIARDLLLRLFLRCYSLFRKTPFEKEKKFGDLYRLLSDFGRLLGFTRAIMKSSFGIATRE